MCNVQNCIIRIEERYSASPATQINNISVIYRFRNMKIAPTYYLSSQRLLPQGNKHMIEYLINLYRNASFVNPAGNSAQMIPYNHIYIGKNQRIVSIC